MDIHFVGDTYMQNDAAKNSKLPFRCPILCVSLVGGSLLLALIYIVYYMGYISTDAALWAAAGVFIVAVLYESFLLSLITRHMINRVNENTGES